MLPPPSSRFCTPFPGDPFIFSSPYPSSPPPLLLLVSSHQLNISPSLLSRESTRIRDLIRSVLHARIDAGGLAALPIGITPAMSNGDTVRPLEAVRGDEVIRDHPMPKVIKRGGWRRFDGPLKVDPSRGVLPGR